MASRILVITDPAGLTAGLAVKLGLDGYLVQTAADFDSAATVASWWLPDAVVVGLGGDAWQTLAHARRLRQTHPAVPLVAVFREEQGVDDEDAQAAGCSLAYPLPVDFRELRLGLEWLIRCADVAHPQPRRGARAGEVMYGARG